MELTNIRSIAPPVSDVKITGRLSSFLRHGNTLNYAKANQRWWFEVLFDSELDLMMFGKAIRGSSVRMVELHGKYFIEDPSIPDSASMSEAESLIEEQLPRLSAAVKLVCPQCIAPRLICLVQLFPKGYGESIVSTKVVVHGKSELEVIAKFLGSPANTEFAAIMKLCFENASVREALYYFGLAENTWANLYKVCEIIEDALGGKEQVIGRGWCSGTNWERFKRTANHQEAVGEFSRHARNKTVPPPNPMSVQEARLFALCLLQSWIHELVVSESSV